MRLRSLASLSAAVVLSLGFVAGCGGDDSSGGSGGDSGGSSKELTKDNFASTIGGAMVDKGSVHVTMKSSGGMAIEAEGDQKIGKTPADTALQMTMSFSGQKFDLRLLDRTVYLNMGALTDNKFAAIDLDDDSNPLVKQFGSLAEQGDIAKQFEQFGEAVTKFEQKGSGEKIDGVDTTPYEVTVDAKKALEASGQSDASANGLPETFTYTFYLGDDDLVRRLTTDVAGQSLTMDFTDWGKDVTVDKPAASQISDTDLSKLLGGGGSTVPE